MSWRLGAVLVVGALFVLAACGSGGGASSQVPATSPSATAATATSEPPTTGASESPPATSASPGASVCRQTADPGEVAVTIADFEFKPATIEAKVGQVVAFANTGFEPHNATTVDGGCGTKTLQTGESDGLVFSLPGIYKFGCTVHRWMTGTFTIAP